MKCQECGNECDNAVKWTPVIEENPSKVFCNYECCSKWWWAMRDAGGNVDGT